MTTAHAQPSQSRLELVVLARFCAARPPKDEKIGQDVAQLLSSNAEQIAQQARNVVSKILPTLRNRALIHGRKITDAGRRVLCAGLGVEQAPTWTDVRETHLAALGLGLKAGSAEAASVLKTQASIQRHLVRKQLGVKSDGSWDAMGDELIRNSFSIPYGRLSLEQIRVYALAGQSIKPLNTAAKRSPAVVAANILEQILEPASGTTLKNKKGLIPALGRRWLYDIGVDAVAAMPGPRATELLQQRAETKPSDTHASSATSSDTLLTLVRETIPRIGSDGRFGVEKVFVSALWRRIERDNRLPNLSLDRFKSWLVTANREQLLDLARADLVGAMDAKLVKESEIQDLGATFHFVVDRRSNGAGQGHHAR